MCLLDAYKCELGHKVYSNIFKLNKSGWGASAYYNKTIYSKTNYFLETVNYREYRILIIKYINK